MNPTIDLLGVRFDAVTESRALERIEQGLDAGVGGWIVTPNVDILRQISARSDLRRFTESADLVVADGAPLIWASRIQGTPLPARVAGSDLSWSVSHLAARRRASLFLLGGAPGAADQAATRITEAAPGLEIAGTLCPPLGYEHDEEQVESIVQTVKHSKPDIVFVCLGFPKQEHLIERLRAAHPTAWYLGLGISLSFIAGDVRRAPAWIQRVGLEWTHRLAQEPRRLGRRYLIDGPPFVLRLLATAALNRLSLRRRRGSRRR